MLSSYKLYNYYTIYRALPGPESISRKEEKVAASLTADLLPAPGRPTRIIPLKLQPRAQHTPVDINDFK